jgi:hypothetical protein
LSISINAQKILFVGNSLTYYNNLPNILESIAKEFDKEITTKMLCYPNYAIVDHLSEGKVQQEINSKKYDLVIIQQGPSSQEIGKKMLIDDGKKLKEICDNNGTKLGYYMVWPSKRYYYTFNKVIENHTEAAKTNNALLFPVGKNWQQYQQQKNTSFLYGPDNFHPSKAGSFLAALTIFHTLYPNTSLEQLPYKKVKKWGLNKKSYKSMIQIISSN